MTREEAIEVLHHTIAFESGFAEAKRMAIEALEKEPNRAEEEWIPDPDGGFWCSNCRAQEDEFIYGSGMRYVNGESKFCPNCGAKMKGGSA